MTESFSQLYSARAALAYDIETRARCTPEKDPADLLRVSIQYAQSLAMYLDLQEQIRTLGDTYAQVWHLPVWDVPACTHDVAEMVYKDEETYHCAACALVAKKEKRDGPRTISDT